MRVAIVDDEAEVRELLSDYIKRFSEESDVELESIQFTCGDSLLEKYTKTYDIIIFDIDMPGTNGMDTARKVRERDSSVTIIFITNVAQYAINGYEVEAVDYIIKPISYYDFSMKFHRAVSKASQKKDHVLTIKVEEGVRRIRMATIIYVEVQSHYLYFYTLQNVYKTRGNMQNAYEALSKYSFVQVHRSYMVNLRYIDKIKSNEVIMGNKVVPVGRAYKNQLQQNYMLYIHGEETR